MGTENPRAILLGVQDLSVEALVRVLERLPQHMPYLYLLTRKGPVTPQLVDGTSFKALYGDRSLDTKYQYAMHPTALAIRMFAATNSCMVQRCVPPDSATAMIRLSVELMPAQIPVYQRNADGSIAYTSDSTGSSVPAVTGFVNGTRVIWWAGTTMWSDASAQYRQGTIINGYRSGNVTSSADPTVLLGILRSNDLVVTATSTLYPVLDIQVDSFGEWGNQLGIQMQPLFAGRLQANTVDAIACFLYQFTCISVNDAGQTAVLSQINGSRSFTGGLKSGLIDPATGNRVSLVDDFVPAYTAPSLPRMAPIRPPFGLVHLYESNLATVLTALTQGYTHQGIAVAGEGAYDTTAYSYGRVKPLSVPAYMNTVNLLTGVDAYGLPYFSIDTRTGADFGGINWAINPIIYAKGGDDGLVRTSGAYDMLQNMRVLDDWVFGQLDQFGTVLPNVLDLARYPYSIFYDTGYSLQTKLKLVNVLNARKDVAVVFSTYSVADYVGPVVVPPPVYLDAPTVVFVNDVNHDNVITNVEYVDPTTVVVTVPSGAKVGDGWTVDMGTHGLVSGTLSVEQLASGKITVTASIGVTPLPPPTIVFPDDPSATGTIVAAIGVNILQVHVMLPAGAVVGVQWVVDSSGFGESTGTVSAVDVANGYVSTYFTVPTNIVFSVSAHFDQGNIAGNIGNASVRYLAPIPQ